MSCLFPAECMFISLLWETGAGVYTHLRCGGQSQVSHAGQISKQLSQLKDNRDDQSHRTSDRRWTVSDHTVCQDLEKTLNLVQYHGLVFLNVLVSFPEALRQDLLFVFVFLLLLFLLLLLLLILILLLLLLLCPLPFAGSPWRTSFFNWLFDYFLLWFLFGGREPFDWEPEEQQ